MLIECWPLLPSSFAERKAKRQYVLNLQVIRYCLFVLQNVAPKDSTMFLCFTSKQVLAFGFAERKAKR